jgi:hypothetical protein
MPPAKSPTPRDIGCVSKNGQWTLTEYGRTKSSLNRQLPEPIDLPAGRATHQVRAGHQPQNRKALGLEVPPTLLARADEVIE